MNKYPVWWDKTVTIYNKLVDDSTQEVTWYRTVVENCFWKYENNIYRVGRSYNSTLVLEAKDVICRIPKDDKFVDKREWKNLSDSERSEHFTLGNGDIIILDEVNDEIDEYEAGKRSTDLVAKYKELQGCIEVDTYVINVGTGVPIEHYRVNGK